jgi:hypothetical protein
MKAFKYVYGAHCCDITKTDVSHGRFRLKTEQPSWRYKSGNRSPQKFQVVQTLAQSPRRFCSIQIVEFSLPGSVNLVGEFYDPSICVLRVPRVKIAM